QAERRALMTQFASIKIDKVAAGDATLSWWGSVFGHISETIFARSRLTSHTLMRYRPDVPKRPAIASPILPAPKRQTVYIHIACLGGTGILACANRAQTGMSVPTCCHEDSHQHAVSPLPMLSRSSERSLYQLDQILHNKSLLRANVYFRPPRL